MRNSEIVNHLFNIKNVKNGDSPVLRNYYSCTRIPDLNNLTVRTFNNKIVVTLIPVVKFHAFLIKIYSVSQKLIL